MGLRHSNILILGQTPPPYHGQAVVSQMLFGHDWSDLEVCCLRMAYSDDIASVGKFKIHKLFHLFELILKTWWHVFSRGGGVLYYPVASANRTPVLRDIIYLSCVRWCFARTVYHFHAGGLPAYLANHRSLEAIARCAYGSPDVAIDVVDTEPASGVYFGAKRNVSVLNGVDVILRERVRSRSSKFRALYVGLLCEGKGLLDVVETARMIKEQGEDCEFEIVGEWVDSSFRDKVLRMIESNQLSEYIHFRGALSGDEKWQAYADADCFLFPTHYEAETFGMVLVEAMAFSLPLVTTSWRGIPKVVGDSGCAFLCDIQNPNQYAVALSELIASPQMREEMGLKARERYQSDFTRDKFISRMEDVFHSVLLI